MPAGREYLGWWKKINRAPEMESLFLFVTSRCNSVCRTCTHSCFIHDSMKFSPRVLLFSLPWRYLKSRLSRLPSTPVEELEKFRQPLPV